MPRLVRLPMRASRSSPSAALFLNDKHLFRQAMPRRLGIGDPFKRLWHIPNIVLDHGCVNRHTNNHTQERLVVTQDFHTFDIAPATLVRVEGLDGFPMFQNLID